MKSRERLWMLAIVSAAIALSGCATGGSGTMRMSRADLVAKGAAQISAKELKEALSGTTVSGVTIGGTETMHIDWNLNADGTLAGSITRTQIQAGTYPQTGKWSVNDRNQFCYDTHGDRSASAGKSYAGCEDWFRLGTALYAVIGSQGAERTLAKR